MNKNQQGQGQVENQTIEYVGFWARTWASFLDTLWMSLLVLPLLWAVYGGSYFDPEKPQAPAGAGEVLISWVLPMLLVMLFWFFKQATPGKMAISARIVDAQTGLPASRAQLVGRYLAYIVAVMPCFLGLIWVAFDRRKQGWHDKLAGTVVVKMKHP